VAGRFACRCRVRHTPGARESLAAWRLDSIEVRVTGMLRKISIAAVVFSLAQSTHAVEPGRYSIGFRMGNDFGGTQEIELLNFRAKANGYGAFDVKIGANGALKRFAQDGQTVQGLYHDGTFTFIIPFADLSTVTAFKFVANDVYVDGRYKGTMFIGSQAEHETREGPFPFWMEKVVAR
jgi:hypothetical protein